MIHNCALSSKVGYQNQQMHVSEWKCIMHSVYLLHVSATHVAIFREVHYREYIHRNVTEFNGTSTPNTLVFLSQCHPVSAPYSTLFDTDCMQP
jgi:hypothetical protein